MTDQRESRKVPIDPARRPAARVVAAPAGDRRWSGALAAAAPILALSALLVLRFWPTLSTPGARVDEEPYLAAFEAIHRGESPYSVNGYFYPPAFAALGGEARRWLERDTLRLLLRAGGVLGAATVVWLASSFLPWAAAPRLLASAVYIAITPGVTLAMRTGNVSPMAAALLIAGLMAWTRAPVASGFLLGAGLVVKPLGTLVPPLLLVHRSDFPARRHWWAGGAALATSLLTALLGIGYLGEFLTLGTTLASEDFPLSRTVSLHRLLLSLGLPVGRVTVAVAVALAAALLARSRSWTQRDFLCLAIAASCLALPALWPHTLLVTLPIQVMALGRALRLDRGSASIAESTAFAGAGARGRIYEVLLVVCGVIAIHLSDGVGGLDPHPSLALAAALTPVVLAPPLLAWYVIDRRAASIRAS